MLPVRCPAIVALRVALRQRGACFEAWYHIKNSLRARNVLGKFGMLNPDDSLSYSTREAADTVARGGDYTDGARPGKASLTPLKRFGRTVIDSHCTPPGRTGPTRHRRQISENGSGNLHTNLHYPERVNAPLSARARWWSQRASKREQCSLNPPSPLPRARGSELARGGDHTNGARPGEASLTPLKRIGRTVIDSHCTPPGITGSTRHHRHISVKWFRERTYSPALPGTCDRTLTSARAGWRSQRASERKQCSTHPPSPPLAKAQICGAEGRGDRDGGSG
eukprot:621618-Pleurochrysis_carterae.AAC.1